MIDFSNINCYDFETLVGGLFKKMGFEVTITSSSGDGGVDVIAINNNPIFKGKYLIQCKYWNCQVGQPEIRDLYGVVMHDKAVKGILVTTSKFTTQALSFANDVGIECIDGVLLHSLFKEYNNEIDLQYYQTHKAFYEYENFNRTKYEFLKSNLSKNVNMANSYFELFNFLFSYVTDNNIEMLYSGLLEEAIKDGREFNKRKKRNERANCDTKMMLLYLLNGEILNAYELTRNIDGNPIFFSKDREGSNSSKMKYNFMLMLSKFNHKEAFEIFYKQYLSARTINVYYKSLYYRKVDQEKNRPALEYTKGLSLTIKQGKADKFIITNQEISYSLLCQFLNITKIQSEIVKLEQIII